jgi:farnesol dehydrogenase
VAGTRNVIEEAQAAGARRIVYTSTFLTLNALKEGLITERDLAGPDAVWTDYARTKREARLVVDDLVAKGAPVVTVYPGVMFGPGRLTAGNLIDHWIIDFLKGRFIGFLGKGDRRWSYAFVEDVARGHLLAETKGDPGDGYILGGENVAQREFMALVADVAGLDPPTRCAPFWLARMLGRFQELRAAVTGREPQVTRAVVETFRHDWALDPAHARERLGYSTTPLRESVERTLRWIRLRAEASGGELREKGLAD